MGGIMLEIEINYIRDNYKDNVYELACELCIPFRLVKYIVKNLGLQINFKWEHEEIEFLKENYMKFNYTRLGEKIDRDGGYVRLKLKELGLKR
jgi:hypothetical protein